MFHYWSYTLSWNFCCQRKCERQEEILFLNTKLQLFSFKGLKTFLIVSLFCWDNSPCLRRCWLTSRTVWCHTELRGSASGLMDAVRSFQTVMAGWDSPSSSPVAERKQLLQVDNWKLVILILDFRVCFSHSGKWGV